MDYIRRYYGVNAKRGGRVRYTGGQKGERFGTIKSARGGYLRIVLDGDKHAGNFHPTWKLEYLQDTTNAKDQRVYGPIVEILKW